MTSRGRPLTVYIGSFTRSGIQHGRAEGISILRFDPDVPALSHEGVVPLDTDPSWVHVVPGLGMAYAAAHTSRFEGQLGGAIVAFAIDATSGRLRRVGHQPLPFPHPNHLCTVGDRYLLASSGLGAGLTVLPLSDDGQLEDPAFFVHGDGRAVIPFGRTTTHVPVPFPRDAAFPHCVIADRDGAHVLVADLMRDCVDVYRFDHATGRLRDLRSTRVHPGAGPRALAFHPTSPFVYAVNETDSTLSALRFDGAAGAVQEFRYASTRNATASGPNKAGSVAAHAQGRFVFVSNRGDDTVATFSVDESGRVSRTGEVASCHQDCAKTRGGEAHPRHIVLTRDGGWLFVCNTYADCVSVFAVDEVSGTLTPATRVTVATPTCAALREA